ncbi:DUF559 domain-containing protein [Microbacterium sp. NPDC089189]|uniref:endonuclease domain-containing protein n=1 Tax=Microbacterium sp. NPDC089189 TaxID=3154972 RepID=UPI0034279A97
MSLRRVASRIPPLLAFVRAEGGVVRSMRLRLVGFSAATVAEAVAQGALIRIRRRWVAVPDADPELRLAAERGVVLSCVTAARRLGLWVLSEDGTHVAAHPHAGRVHGAALTVHRAAALVPRSPDALTDPLENMLAVVAVCQPHDAALAVFDSALRAPGFDRLAFERLDLPGRAREILAEAHPFSDSGLESLVVPRLRWMRVRIVPQAWIAGHRVDFLIGDRLVLQIDGAHHVGAQRDADIRHDARLTLMGYHVIRVGYAQIVHDWPAVQHDIMRAVAQGLHRAA